MKAKELCEKAGINENQLHHWVTRGVVEAIGGHPGRGHEREYTNLSLDQAICAKRLSKYEMSTSGMKIWMEEMGV